MLSGPQLTWVNLQVDEYLIEELLAEGTFSWVYRGCHMDRMARAAFKVAKGWQFISPPARDSVLPSQAIEFRTGGIGVAAVDPFALLARQGQTLSALADPALVAVEDMVQEESMCYLRLELIEGKTLRQMLAEGPVPLSIFTGIASALARLGENPAWLCHGDLKPENIMVCQDGIKLIDPGYFGVLPGRSGELDCAVTTPAYYPTLEGDDLLAFGIMFWEAAMRQHPLYPVGRMLDDVPYQWEEGGDETGAEPHVGSDLLAWVRSFEHVGKYYLTPILDVLPPRLYKADVAPPLENALLAGLRLKADGDVIEKSCGFASFAEFAGALKALESDGIRAL